jgi:hypothetical protein
MGPSRVGRACVRRGTFLRASIGASVALGLLGVGAPVAFAGPLSSDRALVAHYVAVEGAKLGVSLPGGAAKFITVTESPKQALDEKLASDGTVLAADAETDCRDAGGGITGVAASCEITIAKDAHEDGEIKATAAHEVFHVFQAVLAGSLANYNRAGIEWLTEGSAEWVQSDLVHNSSGARDWWRTYLSSPHMALFDRSYDAIGFFGHLASSGASPWSRFKAMFAATSNAAAYAAAGVSETALDSEASVFFREPSFGSAWDQQGPDVPTRAEVGFKPTEVKVKSDEELLSASAYADGAYRLSLKLPSSKPVLEVRVSGAHVRLHSTGGGDVNEVDPGDLDLCTDPHGCDCPGQPSNNLKQFHEGDLAIAGGPSGGEVWLIPRPRCEVDLPQRSCVGLLPEFTIPVAQTLEAATQQPLSGESSNPAIGFYDSYCLFPGAKGDEVENAAGESVFDGVGALLSYVKRYGKVAEAEKFFEPPPSVAGSTSVRVAGIGDEAAITTTTAAGTDGEEYASIAAVRVRNILAGFSIISSGGNDEASMQGAEELLRRVAAEL